MKNRVTPWTEIHQEYITTELTISALGRKYGTRRQEISTKANKDNWKKERDEFQTSTGQAAHARIQEAAIAYRVKLYDSTRTITDKLIAQLLAIVEDPMALRRNIAQMETENETYSKENGAVKTKQVEDVVLARADGKNIADLARALKDLATVTRQLDGIIDAPDQAKLDLEREKLDLEKRRTGMDDDREQESGICIIPAIDDSLLDTALPDPDQGLVV